MFQSLCSVTSLQSSHIHTVYLLKYETTISQVLQNRGTGGKSEGYSGNQRGSGHGKLALGIDTWGCTGNLLIDGGEGTFA